MKISVPDSWNEVTIRQFQEIKGVEDSRDRALEICSILLDKDPEEIRKYDAQSVARILRALEWAMIHPKDEEYVESLVIDGVEYRMIENLNHFSGGEWWDMEEYLDDYVNNLHNILAMIYRPDGEYDAEKCRKRGEMFLDKVNIGQVYGALVFFSLVAKKSTRIIADYSVSRAISSLTRTGKK